VWYNFGSFTYCDKRTVDNQEQPDQKHPETNTGIPVDVAKNPVPVQPATEQQLRETEQKIEEQIGERMTGFERSMVRLTRYGLAVTVLTGIIFAGQLFEMISGGSQTDKLVEYARKQSESATKMVSAADGFALSATGVETHTKDAAKAIEQSAKAAKQSADTATKMFESQRPSIAIENTEIRHLAEGRVMEYFITLKNFSNVTAYKTLIRTCGMTTGYTAKVIHIPDRPTVMPPQKEVTFKGVLIGEPNDAVMAGRSTFDMFTYAEYQGPDKKHYTYCEQNHYILSADEFANLGECDSTQEAFAKTSCLQ
jgi:hypothetical protein